MLLITKQIELSLREFSDWLKQGNNPEPGKDLVNAFIHRFMIPHGEALNTRLCKISQVVIEKQFASLERNDKQVNADKDLLLWCKPRQDIWDPNWENLDPPLALIDWRFREGSKPDLGYLKSDLDQVQQLSAKYPKALAYLVVFYAIKGGASLEWVKVSKG